MASLLGGLAGAGGGILALVTPQGKVPGTGLHKVVSMLGQLGGGAAQNPAAKERLAHAVLGELPGLFGDYPSSSDVGPSSLFIALFSIFALSHFYIFLRNKMNGQNFWPSFGLAMYCVMRVIGFGLRINWSFDNMRVQTGIAATVFCVVPVVYISIMNMLFGHRIFTWRHPETGDSKWFNGIMITTYLIVLGVIAMGILGQAIPYLYFLDDRHLRMCRQVAQAAAILQTLYSFAGLALIIIAYTFKPGTIDHRFGKFGKAGYKAELPATISPVWIESTGLFYFPKKGSQIRYFKDQVPEGKAIRVIASKNPPADGLATNHTGNHPNGPSITTAVMLVLITSVLLSLSSAFRTASTFNIKPRAGIDGRPLSSWLYHKWLLYFFFGAIEVIVNVLYLVFRADLRFYIPDMQKTRKASDPPYNPTTAENKTETDHVNNASSF